MTKEDFLDGKKFRFDSESFCFSPDTGPEHIGYISKFFLGKPEYFGNVSKVTEQSFTCYTYFFRKSITVNIKLSECTLIPQTKTSSTNETDSNASGSVHDACENVC